ncbi:uncharacterized protein LOC116002983 [Ipomoea triloba]|uniref:uncharacterized protein LOC116002983 n=1 Tax=Ipomoea triloba TaxID=35885 RepID=UPI00125E26B6|nr:uncharacterized protein LOC116002983 [Ipomoea triloba]
MGQAHSTKPGPTSLINFRDQNIKIKNLARSRGERRSDARRQRGLLRPSPPLAARRPPPAANPRPNPRPSALRLFQPVAAFKQREGERRSRVGKPDLDTAFPPENPASPPLATQMRDSVPSPGSPASPLSSLVPIGESKIKNNLVDRAQQLRCTVWDHHVSKIEPWFNKECNCPVIVLIHMLIQLCRLKRDCTNGDVKLSNSYAATHVLINEDAPKFIEFKESISDVQTSLRSINTISSLSQTNFIDTFSSGSMVVNTISEVYVLRQYGDYWVVAKIVEIETDKGWCYSSC